MQPFVCGTFINKCLIVSRFGKTGITINKEMYRKILELSKTDSKITPLISDLLDKMGTKIDFNHNLNDVILVKEPTSFSFGRVSYDITEICNYRCKHCYLGRKTKSNLSVLDKKNIIKLIGECGCLWLQITGGEPLLDRDFVEVYSSAHSLGLLITLSTNGSLLTESRIANTLKSHPPYRITVSMYGATATSYEALTQTKGSFQQFINSLHWSKEAAIRTRLNIIITKYNQNEMNDMINLAEKLGFEYYVFSNISPTINGNAHPLELMARDCEKIEEQGAFIPKKDRYAPCEAGQTSFHVNSRGEASICKTARKPAVNLLREGTNAFNKLSQISNQIMNQRSLCTHCETRESCNTCPLILKLYLQGKVVPSFVCSKYYSKGGD